jgi:hypothetical protein
VSRSCTCSVLHVGLMIEALWVANSGHGASISRRTCSRRAYMLAMRASFDSPSTCGVLVGWSRHAQFREKNRRDIGKSQSIWTDSKMETPAVICREFSPGGGGAGRGADKRQPLLATQKPSGTESSQSIAQAE